MVARLLDEDRLVESVVLDCLVVDTLVVIEVNCGGCEEVELSIAPRFPRWSSVYVVVAVKVVLRSVCVTSDVVVVVVVISAVVEVV